MKAFAKTALSVLFSLTVSTGSFAQENIIHLSGNKFTASIVEKWITEYKKENPLSTIRVESDNSNSDNSGIRVVAHQVQAGELNGEQVISYAGRYALVPVTNPNNPLLGELKNGIAKKDLKELVFSKTLDEEYADAEDEEDVKYNATVYARDNKASTVITLAKHFGQAPEQIKGKKVIGDDIYLLNAIKKDDSGLAFNSLNYVFDLSTRRLKQDIALLPLKLKSNQKEAFNSQNIDNTLALLETTSVESVPVERFGFILPASSAKNKEVVDFVSWVLNEGQKYNNELGFLKLDTRTLTAQKEQFISGSISLK